MREYVSDYIGLPLLTRGGERIGYVKNVQTDKNLTRVRNLECCGEDEEEFALPLSAAATFGEGAIVVKSPCGERVQKLPARPFRHGGVFHGRRAARPRARFRAGWRGDSDARAFGRRELAAGRIAGVTDTVLIDLSEDFVPKPVTRAKRKAAQGKTAAANSGAANPLARGNRRTRPRRRGRSGEPGGECGHLPRGRSGNFDRSCGVFPGGRGGTRIRGGRRGKRGGCGGNKRRGACKPPAEGGRERAFDGKGTAAGSAPMRAGACLRGRGRSSMRT